MDELSDLRARVARLEQALATIQKRWGDASASPETVIPARASAFPRNAPAPTIFADLPATASVAAEPPAGKLPPPPPPPPLRVESSTVVRNSEYWFNKLGIGLVLLGLAFLFKYAIDQGWLTPLVRVGIGLAIGALLLGLGLRLRLARPSYAQVLQGGGIAAFYITDFAAFQLFALLPYPLAFVTMCLITLLAFVLAVWQNAMVLALIAALGGLATPFVLYTDTGSVIGLIGYSSLVLGGIATIALARRWRPLLWTGVLGGWLILLLAGAELPLAPDGLGERWATQLGVLWAGLLFWLLPVAWLAREPAPSAGATPPPRWALLDEVDLTLLTLITPFIGLALSVAIWEFSKEAAGTVAVGLALLAGLGAWLLRGQRTLSLVAYAHGMTALLLGTTALGLLLEGNTLLIVLAVEGLLVQLVAARRNDELVAGLGHALFAGLGLWVAWRLQDPVVPPPLLNLQSLSNLLALALACAASFGMRRQAGSAVYWLLVHLLVLAQLGVDLSSLENGSAYLSIAWGCYGLALLILGLRRDWTAVTLYGVGTLALVVAKLILLDLAALAAIWRILLFLGFGGVFLVLSYYLRALWHPRAAAAADLPAEEAA